MKNKFILISLLFLSSCENGFSLFDKKKESMKGERINILSYDLEIKTDQSLNKDLVNFSAAETNKGWFSSDKMPHGDLPENFALNLDNFKVSKFNIPTYSHELKQSLPIIVEDNLYYMYGNKVTAYKITNNKLEIIWSLPIENKVKNKEFIAGALSYSDGKLYISTGTKDFICVDALNGKEIWKYKLSNYANVAPTINNNIVLVPTIDSQLYALDTNTGALKWINQNIAKSLGVFGGPSAAVAKNLVIIPYSAGKVEFINLFSGNTLTSKELSTSNFALSSNEFVDIDHTPVIARDKVYLQNNQGIISAINLNTGSQEWQVELKNVKSFWLAGDYIFANVDNKQLVSISTKKGSIRFAIDLPSNKTKSIKYFRPLVANQNILLASNNGNLLVISANDGKIIKNHTIPAIDYSPIIANKKLYLLGKNTLTVIE